MLGLDLRFDPDVRVRIAGLVVYGVEVIACAVLLWHRRHPHVHRLSPRMLAVCQAAAFFWFLSLMLNKATANLWDEWGWKCWIPQISVRVFFFTAFVASLISRHYVVYSRWLSVEKFRKSFLLINGCIALSAAALLGALVVSGNGDVSDEICGLCDRSTIVLTIYHAVLLVGVCVMAIILARTVYIDTRADYSLLHPKALNAVIDMVAVVMMMVTYAGVYHGSHDSSDASKDNIFTVVTTVVIPACMFWSQLIPALLGVGQQLPAMSFFPSQVFDHSTGAFTSNVAHLPKLRRVIADDTQRLKQHINDATSIPVHDTENLFELIINGDVDEIRNFLLERGVELLGVPGQKGETALHVAVGDPELPQEMRMQVVELLMDMKASLGAQDNQGRTPLHIAATLSDPQIVCFMVQSAMKSAKFGESSNPHMTSLINVIANDGATPLHIATKLEDMGTLTMLIGMGADPSRCAPNKTQVKAEDWDLAYENSVGEIIQGKASFMIAVEIGSLSIVQHMVTSSPRTCDLEQLGPFGMTPLMTACYLRHTQVALYLLKNGANVWHTMPSSRPSRGLSVLHCCAIGGDPLVLNAAAKELTSGTQMPIGTDTDTYEKCTSISESDSMTPVQMSSGGQENTSPPLMVDARPPESGRSPSASSHLLERSLQIGQQYSADSLPRIGTNFLSHTASRSNQGTINGTDGAAEATNSLEAPPTDDDVRAAMTILAARGELEPLPEEQILLASLEDVWEAASGGSHTGHLMPAVEKAIADALAAHDGANLKCVLTQGQYQWVDGVFSSPLTAVKTKQLAAEIRRRVVNPVVDISNFADHEQRLCAQARNLKEQEQDKILRSLDILARYVEHLTGERVSSLHYRSPVIRSSSSSPRLPFSRSPPDGLYDQLKKDILFLTDTDSMPLNAHRYLNRCDCWGRTALHWAVLRRNSGVVYFLVTLGSSVSIRDRKSRRRSDVLGLTSMQYAEKLYSAGCSGPYLAIAESERHKLKMRQRTSTSLRADEFSKPPLR